MKLLDRFDDFLFGSNTELEHNIQKAEKAVDDLQTRLEQGQCRFSHPRQSFKVKFVEMIDPKRAQVEWTIKCSCCGEILDEDSRTIFEGDSVFLIDF